MGRTKKTKQFLKWKKVPKLYFHFWTSQKCPPFFFLIHTWWCENITAGPCGKSRCLRGRRHSSILYSPSGFFPSYFINEVNFWHYKKYGSVGRFTVFGTYVFKTKSKLLTSFTDVSCSLVCSINRNRKTRQK